MPTGRMSRGKRLMGFEPTTFCMASTSRRTRQPGTNRSNQAENRSASRYPDYCRFTRIHADLGIGSAQTLAPCGQTVATMRDLGSVSEDEMVLAFLEAEVPAPRWTGRYRLGRSCPLRGRGLLAEVARSQLRLTRRTPPSRPHHVFHGRSDRLHRGRTRVPRPCDSLGETPPSAAENSSADARGVGHASGDRAHHGRTAVHSRRVRRELGGPAQVHRGGTGSDVPPLRRGKAGDRNRTDLRQRPGGSASVRDPVPVRPRNRDDHRSPERQDPPNRTART